MKKIIQTLLIVDIALIITACGKQPKLPENPTNTQKEASAGNTLSSN